jgi:Tol biopolymer transport system component
MRLSRANQWSVIRQTLVRQEVQIIVKTGEVERVIYKARPGDIAFADPSLSPLGSKVGFSKTVQTDGDGTVQVRLCILDSDGSGYTELPDVTEVTGQIAWSRDQQKIAFLGARRGEATSVVVLDVTSQPPVVLLERRLRAGKLLANLTAQAWAPDNRRLVYTDRRDHLILLDIVANTETDLDVGNAPTWSPDGRFIAYRKDVVGRPPGDYFLLSPSGRLQSVQLLSNDKRLPGQPELGWFLGPPIWSPDSQFIVIARVEGAAEFERPYIVKVATREIEALPRESMGDMRSWGGKP